MRLSQIDDKNRPDYWPRKIRQLETEIAKLRTARSGNATVIGQPTADLQIYTVSSNGDALSADSHALVAFAPPGTAPADLVKFPCLYAHELAAGDPTTVVLNVFGPAAGGAAYGQGGLVFDGSSATMLQGHDSIQVTQDGGLAVRRHHDGTSTTDAGRVDPYSVAFNSGVAVADGGTEARIVQDGSTGPTYMPIRASSFPTGSSREIKTDVVEIPFDSVAAIKAAAAQQWRYLPEYAHEDLTHIGPMAEDLPAALVTETDGIKGVDLLSLVGTLWDAVGKLAARVEALEAAAAPTPPVAPPSTSGVVS